MRDLYLKRNQLCDLSFKLRNHQFNIHLNKQELDKVINIRRDVYKRWKFYDEYIKIGGKVKNERKEICVKER